MNVWYKKVYRNWREKNTVHTCMFGWLGEKEAEKRCVWLCLWIRERERERENRESPAVSRVAISKGKDTPRRCMPFHWHILTWTFTWFLLVVYGLLSLSERKKIKIIIVLCIVFFKRGFILICHKTNIESLTKRKKNKNKQRTQFSP
jgi:hypothetical protein